MNIDDFFNEAETPALNKGAVIASKICKYCNNPIPENDKVATYGDGTLGCSKCERSIDAADMNPWKNDNSYWL
jgi:hypothetical protein